MEHLLISFSTIGSALALSVALVPSLAPAAPPHSTNIVFVDNVRGSDANPGTFAQPKATIQEGENTAEFLYGANGIVVVGGGGPAYVERVVVSGSMKFLGNGLGIPGMNGRFHHTPAPVVDGGFEADGVESVTVSGFDITSNSGDAVLMTNVDQVVVSRNNIHDLRFADGVGASEVNVITTGTAESTASVRDNKLGNPYGLGVNFTSRDDSSIIAEFTGNEMTSTSGAGVLAESYDESGIDVTVSKNTGIEVGSSGAIVMNSWNDSELRAQVDQNKLAQFHPGIVAQSSDGSVLQLTAERNEIDQGSFGVAFVLLSQGESHQISRLERNEFMHGAAGGIFVWAFNTSQCDFLASKNKSTSDATFGGVSTFSALANEAAQVNAMLLDNHFQGEVSGMSEGALAALNFTVTGNSITVPEGSSSSGIGVFSYTGGSTTTALIGNHIQGVPLDGIFLLDDGTGNLTVTELDSNRISDVGGNGIQVNFISAASTVTGTKNNVVRNAGLNSLEVINEPVDHQIIVNGATIAPLVDAP